MRYKGEVISYLEHKGFGFIKNSDGKEVFFHKKNLNNQSNIIVDGMILEYDLTPTKKGYAAKKIDLLSDEEIKYITPDTIYLSKSENIKGWETLQRSGWEIGAFTRKSLDEAIEELKYIAKNIGANALLGLTYNKTTESESSDSGNGTHYYTLHHYWAEPAIIGKKSIKGDLSKNDIPDSDLDDTLSDIYRKNKEKNIIAFINKIIWWIIVLFFVFFLYKYQWPDSFFPLSLVEREHKDWTAFIPSGLIIILGIYIQNIVSHGDYNDWLRKKV